MNKVYWIDDNIMQIINFSRGIFKRMWGDDSKEGIASIVLVFGDEYKKMQNEGDWDEKEIKRLGEKIRNILIRHCRDLDMWNYDGKLFKRKENLVSEVPRVIDQDERTKQTIEAWKNKDLISKMKIMCAAGEKEKIPKELQINDIIKKMNIEAGACVAIDISLLSGDRKRVDYELPIISMQLYHEIKKTHSCFLYSCYTHDGVLIKKWKELYNMLFGEEVTIYSGRNLFEESQSQQVINEITKNFEINDKKDGKNA